MKKLINTFWIIVLGLFLNSCGVGFEYTLLNHSAHDPIYGENYIELEVIDSEEELERKWIFDTDFSMDYTSFLIRQDYSFFSDLYWRNRMWRWGWRSSWDLYTNWQWGWYTDNYWSPFNRYPWYGNWNSSYWYWQQWNNPWHYSYIYGPRTSYLGNVYGRRGTFNRGPRISTQHSISNTMQINRTRPRVIQNNSNRSNQVIIQNNRNNSNWNNKPVIRDNSNTVRPNWNNNNTRTNWNNSNRTIRHNNSRSINSNTVKPSNNTRSISTPRKRGGQ